MEPRARLGKNRGVQAFDDQPLNQFLFSFGDNHEHQAETRRILDELITDFITEICFEAHRGAYLAGRQKIKLDDIKFACRKSPQYLGKIEEVFKQKDSIDKLRKMADLSNDQIAKGVKAVVEELGDADDVQDALKNMDSTSTGGKSTSKGKSRVRN